MALPYGAPSGGIYFQPTHPATVHRSGSTRRNSRQRTADMVRRIQMRMAQSLDLDDDHVFQPQPPQHQLSQSAHSVYIDDQAAADSDVSAEISVALRTRDTISAADNTIKQTTTPVHSNTQSRGAKLDRVNSLVDTTATKDTHHMQTAALTTIEKVQTDRELKLTPADLSVPLSAANSRCESCVSQRSVKLEPNQYYSPADRGAAVAGETCSGGYDLSIGDHHSSSSIEAGDDRGKQSTWL